MQTFQFTLIITHPTIITSEQLSKLKESCSDVLVGNGRPTSMGFLFDREEINITAAVARAVGDIVSVITDGKLTAIKINTMTDDEAFVYVTKPLTALTEDWESEAISLEDFQDFWHDIYEEAVSVM